MDSVGPAVFLNGRFLDPDDACVPVLDRGFLFGDGVYEVIPVYGGCPFRVDAHLRRLDASLAGIRIANPRSPEAWRDLFRELLARNAGAREQAIYLQITRGAGPRDHRFPEGVEPTVFAMCSPVLPPAPEEGVAVVSLPDQRWARCQVKAITLLANVLARQEAADAGAAEALLVREGQVVEGSSSNVFAVLDGVVVTPPAGPRMLTGVTRDLVLELLDAAGIPTRERGLTMDELGRAEEVWITSSTREVVPVVQVDGAPVGEGVPGSVWRRVRGLYQDYKARFIAECVPQRP